MSNCPQLKDMSVIEVLGDAAMFWEKRLDLNGDGNPVYIAWNKTPNASQSSLSWFLVKLTYSGLNVVRYQLPDAGCQFKYSYTARATYFS